MDTARTLLCLIKGGWSPFECWLAAPDGRADYKARKRKR
jgi:hypothetical protein